MALIYIVEDDGSIGEIESFALRNAGFETKQFTCMSDFRKAAGQRLPTLVVMDVVLPDADGFHAVMELRQHPEWAGIPILMVSAKSLELDIVKGLDCGADDYLTKPFGIMEFVSRIRALIRRIGTESEGTDTLGDSAIELDKGKREVRVRGKLCSLTYKEFELLYALMSHPDHVMTRDFLMEEIWGIDFGGESRTLDMHIRSLRKKLGEEGRHIRTIRNVGYCYEVHGGTV